MQKTVKEIIDMINRGVLHYNQSTQRKFIYASLPAQLNCGKTTKAGSLIYSILEEKIQLPAVYFWYNTDTNELNIHDGKQRILSLYYFITSASDIQISTCRQGKELMWDGLSQEEQEYLLNYTLDIVERSGTSAEEERSFYLLNTNSVNLTNYECVSGMLHGQFLSDFETYVNQKTKTLDKVVPVGRGEQAYKFLLALFNFNDSEKALTNEKAILNLTNELHKVRTQSFSPAAYRFNELLEIFNELLRSVNGLKEDRALAIASYIIKNNYKAEDIECLYKKSVKQPNDISAWDIATHKTFIDAYVINHLELDPQRNFSKDVKDALYTKSPRCAHIDDEGHLCTETSYSRLEVDHIQPWSKGGRTIIDNAQLLCKVHNTSKGNKE